MQKRYFYGPIMCSLYRFYTPFCQHGGVFREPNVSSLDFFFPGKTIWRSDLNHLEVCVSLFWFHNFCLVLSPGLIVYNSELAIRPNFLTWNPHNSRHFVPILYLICFIVSNIFQIFHERLQLYSTVMGTDHLVTLGLFQQNTPMPFFSFHPFDTLFYQDILFHRCSERSKRSLWFLKRTHLLTLFSILFLANVIERKLFNMSSFFHKFFRS